MSKTTAVNVYTGATDELHKLVITRDFTGKITNQTETTTARNVGPTNAQGQIVYTVLQGETLSSIASKVWADTAELDSGNTNGPNALWYKIAQANPNLQFPTALTVLQTGSTLIIPKLTTWQDELGGSGGGGTTGLPAVQLDAYGNVQGAVNQVDPALYAQAVAEYAQKQQELLDYHTRKADYSSYSYGGDAWLAPTWAVEAHNDAARLESANTWLSQYFSNLAASDPANAAQYNAAIASLNDGSQNARDMADYATQISVPPPPQKSGGCGAILLGILSIAIAVILPFAAPATFGLTGSLGIAGPALAGAIGSAVGQGIGLATGLQDRFNFGAVGMAFAGGLIGGALGGIGQGASGFGKVAADFARGALANAATQGVAIAAGLQKKFDWAGVAAGGIVSGVGGAVSRSTSFAGKTDGVKNTLISGLAGGVAGAATRSLIDDSDFGENLKAVLPDVVGAVIGRLVAGQVSAREARGAKAAGSPQPLRLAQNDVPRMPWEADIRSDIAPAPELYGPEITVTANRGILSRLGDLFSAGADYVTSYGGTFLAGWGRFTWNAYSSPSAPAIPFAGANVFQLTNSFQQIRAALNSKVSDLAAVPQNYDQPGFGRGLARGYVGSTGAAILGPAGSQFADMAFGPVRNRAEAGGLTLYQTTELAAGSVTGVAGAAKSGLGNLARSGSALAQAETVPAINGANMAKVAAERTIVGYGPKLLPGEGMVGTYDDLIAAGVKGNNITPHHIPSANRMALEEVSRGNGIAINMEQPFPGVGGRHRATFTYGTKADINMTARDALAAGVWDARRIYRADGLYTPQIRSSLQDLMRMNKTNHPTIFGK